VRRAQQGHDVNDPAARSRRWWPLPPDLGTPINPWLRDLEP